MEETGTIFYLFPINDHAKEIVDHVDNVHRRCAEPDDFSTGCLRIGIDQHVKSPPHLARFGRHQRNDVLLGGRFSRNDQCYFDFNRETGELLLHDISVKGDTKLFEPGKQDQLHDVPRQCVVFPDHDSDLTFQIGTAELHLTPPFGNVDQDAETFTKGRLEFAGQPDPERTNEEIPGQPKLARSLSASSYHNDNVPFPNHDRSEENKVIAYKMLKRLGCGGQGEVFKVVNLHTGDHLACKTLTFRTDVQEWTMPSERQFKAKVEMEVEMVKNVEHGHIVPYVFTQGWAVGEVIEIFMPVFEGSLHDVIKLIKKNGKDEREGIIATMFCHIALALDHIHTRTPPMIHRDVKPANILYRGNKFSLTDFGVAKIVDTSATMVGTTSYIAPEIRLGGVHTPKLDIYAFGATIVESLGHFSTPEERMVKIQSWDEWYKYLLATAHSYHMGEMLDTNPGARPTARDLLDYFFKEPHMSVQSIHDRIHSLNVASSSDPALVNMRSPVRSPEKTPMDWSPASLSWPFISTSQQALQMESLAQLLQKGPSIDRGNQVTNSRLKSIKAKNKRSKESLRS